MSPGIFAVLAGVFSALVSPLVAYTVATRKLSGKVNTSEASELWKESSSIREDYRERLRFSDESLRRLEERIQKLEESNDALLAENRQLRRTIDKQNVALAELQKENEALHAQINGIQRKVNGGTHDTP